MDAGGRPATVVAFRKLRRVLWRRNTNLESVSPGPSHREVPGSAPRNFSGRNQHLPAFLTGIRANTASAERPVHERCRTAKPPGMRHLGSARSPTSAQGLKDRCSDSPEPSRLLPCARRGQRTQRLSGGLG